MPPLRLSDTELILIVLAAFYLSECLCWLPRRAVAFVSGWKAYWPRWDAGLLQNDNGGLLAGSFSPGGTVFVCPEPELMNRIRTQLAAASRLSPTERESATVTLVQNLTDTDAIKDRLEQFCSSTSLLRMAGGLLFVLLFVFAPLLYYTSKDPSPYRLWVFLGLLGIYWLIAIVSHFRAHGKLYPTQTSERRKRLLMTCCSPAVAMKAADALGRPLFQGFHPLAVATVVCTEEAANALAIPILREMRNPLPVGDRAEPSENLPDSESTLLTFQRQLQVRLEQLYSGKGLTAHKIDAAPPRDRDAVAFCPRCHRQFVLHRTSCDVCAGLPLKTFPEENVPIPEEVR